jgi:sirohydrochlorin cobaltochelatase
MSPPRARTQALLLFSHGSPEPEWSAPLIRLQDILAAREPGKVVALAFLPPAAPAFADVVEQLAAGGVRHVTVAPVFLARGGHVKRDLPEMVAQARKLHDIDFNVLTTLGEADVLLEAIAAWIAAQAAGAKSA